MSILRSFDPNHARRVLRDYLVEVSEQVGDRGQSIPHSFQTDLLLDHASVLLARRDVQRKTELYHRLLVRTGVASVLCGREADGLELFERGLRSSRSNQRRARFRYHIGHHYYQRRGDMNAAREELKVAFQLSERSRRLRTQTLLALGTTEQSLDLHEAALKSLTAALELHVRDLEPHSLMRQGIVRMRLGEFDDAEKLNRKSHQLFKRHRDWLGMNIADRNLAVLGLERGDAESARTILTRTVAEENRVLDLSHIGRDYNNLAVANSRLGDHRAARDALLMAIRYNSASGRSRLLSGNYHNLGWALSSMRDLEGAFAAFERALELSSEVGSLDAEFETLTDIVDVSLRHQARLEALPQVLRRCYEILEENAEALSKSRILDFSRITRAMVGNPHVRAFRASRSAARTPKLGTREGRSLLRELLPGPSECDFDALLARRLGEGMRGRYVPPVENLRQFLLLYTGDYFKSANYTGEFDITQERAKRHLRWLCGEGIIERYGSRKASRYALAFHR